MTDTLGKTISAINNGYLARKSQIDLAYSRYGHQILDLLVKEGFLKKVEVTVNEGKKYLSCTLEYKDKRPAVTKIKMISKPGLRVYRKVEEIKPVLGGLGRCLISTPKGLMTGKEARKKKLGGEVILEVY